MAGREIDLCRIQAISFQRMVNNKLSSIKLSKPETNFLLITICKEEYSMEGKLISYLVININ